MSGRLKQAPIGVRNVVFFTVLPGDVRPLKYFEQKIALEADVGISGVQNAEILRYAIHRGYELDRRAIGPKEHDRIIGAKIPWKK